jgi:predicted CXXCH cytochrome family protein
MVVLTFTFSLGTIVVSKGSGSRTLDWHKGGKKAKIDFAKHKAAGIKCNQCHRKHKSGSRQMMLWWEMSRRSSCLMKSMQN